MAARMKRTLALLALLFLAVSFVGVTVHRGSRMDGGAGEGTGPRHVADAHGEPVEAVAPGGDAYVTGLLVADLPSDCAERGGVRALLIGGDASVRDERLQGGAFVLRYARGSGHYTLRLGGERLVTQEFALPHERTDLGEVHLRRSVSFGGRVLDLEGHPLEGVVVSVSQEGALTEGNPSGPDGAYRVELPGSASLTAQPDGTLYRVLLYARRGSTWGGPYYATRRGFDLNEELRIRLSEDPVLRLLSGEGRAPLREATVVLRQRPPDFGVDPGMTCARAISDGDGRATLPWPPWVDEGHLEVRTQEGESTFLTALRSDVFASAVYTLVLDEANTVRVRLRVLDDSAPTGVRVRVDGIWSPYGVTERGPEGGATELTLMAAAPESGEIEWRFVAERQPGGCFLPYRWICEDRRGGAPRVLRCDYEEIEPPHVLPGGTLDPIRLGDAQEGADLLLVRFSSATGRPPLCLFAYPGGDGTSLLANGEGERWRYFVRHVREEWAAHENVDLTFVLAGPRVAKVRLTTKELMRAVDAGEELSVSVPAEAAVGRVRIVDPDGAPVPAAFVQVSPPGPLSFALASSSVTDAAGRAEFPYDPGAGVWRLIAVDRRTQAGALVPEWFDGGRERTVHLERATRLSFRIALEGDKTRRIWAQIISPSFELAPFHSLLQDRDGLFRTPPVAPALYRLHVYAHLGGALIPGGLPLVQIEEGSTVTVR